MKWIKLICVAIVLICSGSNMAWADQFHHRGHVRVYAGPPIGWAWYYTASYPPYYYGPTPSVVTVPAAPPIYITPAQPQAPSNDWYYCNDPDGYYPYVKQCPSGWQKVTP